MIDVINNGFNDWFKTLSSSDISHFARKWSEDKPKIYFEDYLAEYYAELLIKHGNSIRDKLSKRLNKGGEE